MREWLEIKVFMRKCWLYVGITVSQSQCARIETDGFIDLDR